MTIEKLKEYFEAEYHFTKTSVERGRADKNAIWYAVQRCLGASDLAQLMGASFADVEPLFEEIKYRLESLRRSAPSVISPLLAKSVLLE